MRDNTITARQLQVLEYIVEYFKEHSCTPSYKEIAKHLGLGRSSQGGAFEHVVALAKKGYLRRSKESRQGVAICWDGVESVGLDVPEWSVSKPNKLAIIRLGERLFEAFAVFVSYVRSENRIPTARELAKAINVSPGTAWTRTNELREAGCLIERPGTKKTRKYTINWEIAKACGLPHPIWPNDTEARSDVERK